MKRIIAAITFFTRLPLWRWVTVDKSYYERVVPLWPLMGWLTGGVMALVLWLTSMVFPLSVSIILALLARVLLTGALHEDGFADFCDAFGGGTDRERTLAIMKDSHVGTYGVLGLSFYNLLFYHLLLHILPQVGSPFILIAVDTFCKYLSSTIIYFLPYARKASEAKNGLIYAHVTIPERIISFLCGILPIVVMMFLIVGFMFQFFLSLLSIIIIYLLLLYMMRRRLHGYTGDCCGATFIILEATFYLFMCLFLFSS